MYLRSVFLNRSRYQDLKTFSPGLGTLEKLKIHKKLQRNQVFLRIKSLQKSITGQLVTKILVTGTKDKKDHFTGTWT
jgi:hypothetical protein